MNAAFVERQLASLPMPSQRMIGNQPVQVVPPQEFFGNPGAAPIPAANQAITPAAYTLGSPHPRSVREAAGLWQVGNKLGLVPPAR